MWKWYGFSVNTNTVRMIYKHHHFVWKCNAAGLISSFDVSTTCYLTTRFSVPSFIDTYIGDKISMPRGDLLSSKMYLYRGCDGANIENLEPSAGLQYAVKHECNNAIPLHDARGEKGPFSWGGRIYMGCLVNQESRVIGHEVHRGGNGRGVRVTGV